MSTTRTESTVPDLATQVDILSLFAEATADVKPRVNIPAPIVKFLDGEMPAFRSHTNRFRRTLVIKSDALALGILANRPKAERNLTGDALLIAAAKEFGRQVRQYAEDNNLSPATTRDGATVVYRLANRKAEKTAEPVTVTQVAEPAAAAS